MPYISLKDRQSHSNKVDEMVKFPAQSAGELNYLVSMLAKTYLDTHGESYQVYNDIIGALEGAKLEIYRRNTAKYEDSKIKLNGDL